jgi:hypothetical protein
MRKKPTKKQSDEQTAKKSLAVLEKPRTKSKRKPSLPNAKLKKLAKKNKPPQSWYDRDESGLW